MSVQLRVAVAALLVGVAVGAAVVLLASGSDGGDNEVVSAQRQATSTPVPPTTPPTQAPPTAVPPTAVPPTPAPAAAAPSAPAPPPPAIRSCSEIRASGGYLSEEERAFFLANCLAPPPTPRPATGPAPAPQPGAPAPAPGGSGLTEEEERYRRRASQVNLEYTARLRQYWGTPSFGVLSDLYELASIALNNANALNALAPVPARYRAPHDTLVNSLLAFRDHILTVERVRTLQEFLAWVATFERLGDTLDANLVSWQRAVGIEVVSLGGLR